MWFVTAVAGLTVRVDVLGVTSIVRALNLRPRLYTKQVEHKARRLMAVIAQTIRLPDDRSFAHCGDIAEPHLRAAQAEFGSRSARLRIASAGASKR
jgi:hypothetical protein